MEWKRRIGALGVIAMIALAACTQGTPTGGGSQKQVIGFSQANGSDEWRTNQNKKVAENCNPVAQTLISDALGDDAVQSSHVDEFVSRPVSVLLLTPNTAAGLTEAAKRALDKKVPVITLDRSVDVEVTQHIGADNKLIGAKAAEYVANTLLGGKGGKIIEIQGVLGASATTDRHNEFKAWLDKNAPTVKIIESQTGEYRREPAVKFMEDMLQRYKPGDFDVVYAHNDEMALGAVQALKTANRLATTKVVGIDGQNEAIDAIKKGEIAATFTYDNAGKEACESAAKLLKGGTVDKTWVLQTNQIDSTNVDQWIGKGF